MSKFIGKLGKALVVYREMTMLVDTCKNFSGSLDMWEIQWDTFWELSNDFPFSVDWCDMDTTYEEDIMARYLAIERFMENINDVMKEVDDDRNYGSD